MDAMEAVVGGAPASSSPHGTLALRPDSAASSAIDEADVVRRMSSLTCACYYLDKNAIVVCSKLRVNPLLHADMCAV